MWRLMAFSWIHLQYFLILGLWLLWTYWIGELNLFQAVCFVTIRPLSKNTYRRINRWVAELLWLELVWIVDWWAGVKVLTNSHIIVTIYSYAFQIFFFLVDFVIQWSMSVNCELCTLFSALHLLDHITSTFNLYLVSIYKWLNVWATTWL